MGEYASPVSYGDSLAFCVYQSRIGKLFRQGGKCII